MRTLVMVVVALVATTTILISPPEASAHCCIGWPIHKAKCLITGKCVDKPPPQMSLRPKGRCRSKDDVGKTEDVYDKVLKRYVRWVCTKLTEKLGGGYDWVREPMTHYSAFNDFWKAQPKRPVYDWHRACKSIVCKPILVLHHYPVWWSWR